MIVTKELVKDLKEAKYASVWRDSKGQGALKLVFEDEIRGKKVDTEKWYLVHATLTSYENSQSWGKDWTKYTEGSHPSCVASLMWLDNNRDTANTAFRFIKAEDEITFQFVGSTHNNIREVGFHHDKLNLLVNRRGTRHLFLLDDSITPQNSARMIGGLDMSVCNAPQFDPTDEKFTNRLDKEAELV